MITLELSEFIKLCESMEKGIELDGTPDNDTLFGSVLADTLRGLGGDDALYGQAGTDRLYGDEGFDVLYGNNGDDYLFGGKDPDCLFGGKGADSLRGGNDEDALVGDAGNDTLIGDLGIDRLWGGEGADLFIFRRDQAAPPQVIGNPQPIVGEDGLVQIDVLPADIILDYRVDQGDQIGLTGGLTANDLILTEQFLKIGDARDYAIDGPYPPNTPRTLDFQITVFAATVIQEAATGNILGVVREVAPKDIQFVSVDELGRVRSDDHYLHM